MADEEKQDSGKENSLKGPLITLALVLGVALLEGGAFFIAFQWFGTNEATYGQDGHVLEEAELVEIKTQEVELLRGFRVPNNKDGRLKVYDFDITVVVPADDNERLKDIETALESKMGEISDRTARVVRSASPRSLNEDDFRTLRLQLRQEYADVLRDPDAVIRVLIPRCVPMYAG